MSSHKGETLLKPPVVVSTVKGLGNKLAGQHQRSQSKERGGGSGHSNSIDKDGGPSSRSGSITSTNYLAPPSSKDGMRKSSPDSRIVVLGMPSVGKSALVVRLLTGRFIWEYDPTLEAAYRHNTTVDDEAAIMDILDTAGQTESVVQDSHARWGEGYMLVFSLTDRSSFNALTEIHTYLAQHKQTPNFSCVIIANKIDLGHLSEVTEEEAEEMASELGATLFLTSACDGSPSISEAFAELHRDIVRRRWSRRRRSSAKTVIEGFYKMFTR